MLKRILETIALAFVGLFVLLIMLPYWIIYYYFNPGAVLRDRMNATGMAQVNDPEAIARRLDF